MVNLSIVLIIDMIITCSHSIFVNGMSVLHGYTNTTTVNNDEIVVTKKE